MTPLEVRFTVPGIPRPQGSKRAFVVKGRPVLTESAGEPLKDWRATIALAGANAMTGLQPFEGPIYGRLTFKMPRPKSHGKKITSPTSRPDIDKLARSVLDALTHICFLDDAQLVTLNLTKRWAQPEHSDQVGVDIHIAKDSNNL